MGEQPAKLQCTRLLILSVSILRLPRSKNINRQEGRVLEAPTVTRTSPTNTKEFPMLDRSVLLPWNVINSILHNMLVWVLPRLQSWAVALPTEVPVFPTKKIIWARKQVSRLLTYQRLPVQVIIRTSAQLAMLCFILQYQTPMEGHLHSLRCLSRAEKWVVLANSVKKSLMPARPLEEMALEMASSLQQLCTRRQLRTRIIHTIIHILRILKILLWENILSSLRAGWISSRLERVAAGSPSISCSISTRHISGPSANNPWWW